MKRMLVVSLALIMVLSAIAIADGIGVFSAFKNGIAYPGTGPPMFELSESLLVENAIIGSLTTNVWDVTISWDQEIYKDAKSFTVSFVELAEMYGEADKMLSAMFIASSENLNCNEVYVDIFANKTGSVYYALVILTPTAINQVEMSSVSVAVNAQIVVTDLSVTELRLCLSALTAEEQLLNEFLTAGVSTQTMFASTPINDSQLIVVLASADIARGLTFKELTLALRGGVTLGAVSLGQATNSVGAFRAYTHSPLIGY